MVMQAAPSSKLARIAVLVDQLSATMDGERLAKAQSAAVRAEVRSLVQLLAGRPDAGAVALSDALQRLSTRLEWSPGVSRVTPVSATRRRRFMRNLRRLAAVIAATVAMGAPMLAAAAIPVLNPGDSVYNPLTVANETVVEKVGPAAVRTNLGNIILLA